MASTLITRNLYNGLYEVVHNPFAKGRAPRYTVNGTNKPKGVTTILGATLSKDLMQWAVDCAIEYLSLLPEISHGDLEEAAMQYIYKRDGGAATGTDAHALVEQFLRHEPVQEAKSQEAMNAYTAFVAWFEEARPTVINVEEVIYSAEYDYAGTYDAMMRINGKVYLTDLKTTNSSRKAPKGVYAEHFIQLGAYAAAHEEQRRYEEANGGSTLPAVEGLAVISAKKNGKLDFVTSDDLGLTVQECADLFHQVVKINRFLGNTTKSLGGN